MNPLRIGVAIFLLLEQVSCTNNFEDASAGQYDRNTAEIEAYIKKNNWGASTTKTNTGLYFVKTTDPASLSTAESPKKGEEVAFSYTLSLLNDRKVDEASDNDPVYLPYGIGAVISGLEEGLSLMKEGQRATLLIPFNLAYGDGRKDSLGNFLVPAYEPVRFDVHLIKVRSEVEQIHHYIQTKKLHIDTLWATNAAVKDTIRLTWLTKVAGTPIIGTSGNKKVTLKYSGRLLRPDRVFDSSQKGNFSFTTNNNETVPGFEAAVKRLKPGEKAMILFPSSLGYGIKGNYDQAVGVYRVPPFAPLLFEVEILKVQ